MRPTPGTAEYIAATAASRPRAPALWEDGQALDYGQLYGFVARCGLALQQLGVRRGDRVAVSGPGFGIQLVALIAAEGLGAVTVNFQAQDDGDAPWLFERVQWVFSCLPQTVPAGVRFVHMDQAFADGLAAPLEGEGPAWMTLADGEPQRIVRTSGSSGASKFLVLPRRAFEWRLRITVEAPGWIMDPQTRFLSLSPLVVNAAFARASACLRHGGMVLVGEGGQIETMRPTHVSGLPLHIERLLDQLPHGYRSPQPVRFTSFGGAVAPVLRDRILQVFGTTVRNPYGSNETGVISEDLDARGIGVLHAGVDLRVLGADGEDLPAGNAGVLAFRTPSSLEGYLDRPEDSARSFRDGWYVSGDVGVWLGGRVVQLLGRHDDLVNVAGLKIPAARLEAGLRAQPAIADAAVLAVHMELGAMTLGIAIVARAGASADEAKAQVPRALQLPTPVQARVLVLQDLPRTTADKVDRVALLRLFRR